MDLFALDSAKFIDLNLVTVGFLFIVGFIGGLVSGFIGSGGAFILTPGMMGLGVPSSGISWNAGGRPVRTST